MTSTTVQGEPVYLYRRLGLHDFVTCNHDRYAELSAKPHLFETKVLYTAPQPAEQHQPEPDVAELVEAAQDDQYPPCDFCGVIPDHHPWHGSGMFKGVDSPHIHACNDCRHLLPSRTAQPAPDVAHLVEALEIIEKGEDTGPDGWGAFRWADCRNIARSALAAHRKQGAQP